MCLFQLYSIHMKKQNSCLGPVRLFVSAVKISGKLKHSYEYRIKIWMEEDNHLTSDILSFSTNRQQIL